MRSHSKAAGPWVALLLALACRPTNSGGPEPATPTGGVTAEPSTTHGRRGEATSSTLEDSLRELKDEPTRAHGLQGLASLVDAAEGATDREVIAAALAPVLVEIWDDAAPHRETILRLCLALARPSLAPVWNLAIGLDGTVAAYEQTLIALDGVERARATGSVGAISDALRRLLDAPAHYEGERVGPVRARMVEVLGELGDAWAVPVLLDVLEQPLERQPAVVHRAVVQTLGRLADPAAVDPLLTVVYRVPDAPSTTSIFEQAKVALAAIGEPAIPRIIETLEGKHPEVQALAAKHGINTYNVELYAAGLLGALGSPTAVEPLLARMPMQGCKGGPKPKPEDVGLTSKRAVIANALGFIGDPRAVGPLCRCATASRSPADMFPIAEALGRIGGKEATRCLVRVIERGRYDPDAVAGPEFQHEIRWEAARFGVLAAPPGELPSVGKAIARSSRDKTVAKHMKWADGIELRRRCGGDQACFEKALADPDASWFSREVAAVTVARLGRGDARVAEAIARAYSVRDPDARVTMAWLAAWVMMGNRCQACAEELQTRLDKAFEEGRLPAVYQLSVLVARHSIAKLREPGR